MRGREYGCLNIEPSGLNGFNIFSVKHFMIHGTHSALATDFLKPFDRPLRGILPGIQQNQTVRIVAGMSHGGLGRVESDETVSELLVGQFIRFDNSAMEHRDYPVLAACGKLFLKGRNRSPQRRIRRFQDIFGPQLLESRLGYLDRLLDLGIVRGVAHRAVDRGVMHDDHHAVKGVLHIALDGRVAVLGGHLDSRRAVLVDVELLSVLKPATSVGYGPGEIHLRCFLA